jgi:hypothetical protein
VTSVGLFMPFKNSIRLITPLSQITRDWHCPGFTKLLMTLFTPTWSVAFHWKDTKHCTSTATGARDCNVMWPHLSEALSEFHGRGSKSCFEGSAKVTSNTGSVLHAERGEGSPSNCVNDSCFGLALVFVSDMGLFPYTVALDLSFQSNYLLCGSFWYLNNSFKMLSFYRDCKNKSNSQVYRDFPT